MKKNLPTTLVLLAGILTMTMLYSINIRVLGIKANVSLLKERHFIIALVALSGAFVAQYQGFADASLGVGMVVSGLAMVMIGEFLIRSTKIYWLLIRVVAGAVVYKAIMFGGRYYGYMIRLTPNDLKLVTGLLIILSLVVTKTDLIGSWMKRREK